MKRLAILGYHKIGAPSPGGYPTWNYVETETFREHLRILDSEGWAPLDVDGLLVGLQNPDTLPERSAMVTFDDGYRSTLTEAAPCLQEAGRGGVIFVPTRFVGRSNLFDEGIEPEEPICSWDELAQLNGWGVAVEAHGETHTAFSTLEPERLREELRACKRELEAQLQRRVRLFAYPYGDAGDGDLVPAMLEAERYDAGLLYAGGVLEVDRAVDRYRLPRLAMGPDSDLRAMLAP